MIAEGLNTDIAIAQRIGMIDRCGHSSMTTKNLRISRPLSSSVRSATLTQKKIVRPGPDLRSDSLPVSEPGSVFGSVLLTLFALYAFLASRSF